MLRAFGCGWRNLGRPTRARFHRDPTSCGRIRGLRCALLAGAARRLGEFERRSDALADRERVVADQRSRPKSARATRLGCRAVPCSRASDGQMAGLP